MNRNRALIATALSALTVGVLVVTLRSTPSPAAETTRTAPTMTNAERRALYRERVRAHETRVAESKPQCPDGLVRWRRGKDVELCALPCTSDLDCTAMERCRVIDHARHPKLPPRFADEEPPAAWQQPGKPRLRALCDPFYDVAGIVTLDPPDEDLSELDAGPGDGAVGDGGGR